MLRKERITDAAMSEIGITINTKLMRRNTEEQFINCK